MSRLVAVAGAFAGFAVIVAAGAACASVTVLGGGFAEACSRYAILGRSGPQFETECTRALEDELLNRKDRAGTYVNRGVMKMRRLEFEPARRDFDAAVDLAPEIGEAYVNRGASLIGLRRYAEGLSDLDKGLALGLDETAKAYFNRGLAHEGLGDAKAAYFDYLKAQELNPEWQAPKDELLRFSISRP